MFSLMVWSTLWINNTSFFVTRSHLQHIYKVRTSQCFLTDSRREKWQCNSLLTSRCTFCTYTWTGGELFQGKKLIWFISRGTQRNCQMVPTVTNSRSRDLMEIEFRHILEEIPAIFSCSIFPNLFFTFAAQKPEMEARVFCFSCCIIYLIKLISVKSQWCALET